MAQPPVEVLFCAGTQNQFDALAGAYERCESSKAFVASPSVKRTGGIDTVTFPMGLAAALSVPFVGEVVSRAWRSEGYLRASYKYSSDRYLLSYGIFVAWLLMVWSVRPRLIVKASDQDLHAGALLAIARMSRETETVYVQHASVTTDFPPLSFDYAFLEGKDAYRKYRQTGASSTDVYLTGMPKADALLGRGRGQGACITVGVCLNAHDRYQDCEDLLLTLEQAPDKPTVILRPHPLTPGRQKRPLADLARAHGAEFSDPLAEPVTDYLGRIDVLVAGESSVHLEAILNGVEPIYYAPSVNGRDVYGYLASGLVRNVARTPAEVVECIAQGVGQSMEIVARAKPYVDTVGTPYFGRSADLVGELLDEIVRSGGIGGGRWTEADETGRAFRLGSAAQPNTPGGQTHE